MQIDRSNQPLSSGAMSARALAFSVPNLINNSTRTLENNMAHACGSNRNELGGSPSERENVSAELLCRDLWLEFHAFGTEMIITKAGRRMFPSLKVRLSGLADDILYAVYINMEPIDNKRYRYVYQSSKWIPGGPGDVPYLEQRYFHPDGVQPGRFWKSQSCISFDKLKLTNSRLPVQRDLISLHSMHRYQPKICIVRIPEGWKNGDNSTLSSEAKEMLSELKESICFRFPETEFITVTAYQNQQITKLKIASNPFAKGFREPNKEARDSNVQEVDRDFYLKRPRLDLHPNNTDQLTLDFLDCSQQSLNDPIYFWWPQPYPIYQPFLSFYPPYPNIVPQ